MVIVMGAMFFGHKYMMSHDKHDMKTEESKTVPNQTDEGNENHPKEHKHTH